MPQSLRHAVKRGYSLSQKRISPFKSPKRKVLDWQSQSRMTFLPPEWKCLRAALPRLVLLYDLPLLLLSAVAQPLAALPPYGCGTPLAGAALPILQKCAVIPVYRGTHQCGERSNAAFRTQSAAEKTSLAPHDSKARLLLVTSSRGSWRSHVHRTYFAQRVQFFELQTANVRGRGVRPLVLSLGGYKGGYSLLRKRVSPFDALPARPQGIPSHPTVRQYEPPPCTAGTPTRQGSHNTAPSRRRSCRHP